MDIYESTRVVFARIQSLEPENVSKIIGYLLLQDHGDREMIRLAFGPDSLIHSLINRAKADLGLLTTNHTPSSQHQQLPISSAPSFNGYTDFHHQFTPFTPVTNPRPIPLSNSAAKVIHSPHWETPVVTATNPQPLVVDQQNFINQCMPFDSSLVATNDDFHIQDQLQQQQTQILSLEDQSALDGYFYHEYPAAPEFQALNGTGMRSSIEYLSSRFASRRSPPLAEFPIKQCVYFARGYCKHGSSCRFLHGQLPTDNMSSYSTSPPGRDFEDQLSNSTLERLEFELLELLRVKRAPISIASLPQLYYDMFGRTLQADGYLTESQRHGKTGYSLTKLLARLKNTIRVIDRPHGQHAVVAAEDAPRYTDYRGEHPAVTAAGARQIYLTFPAESTFTEEDVSNYFRNFGPVQDVRIPCQQKRMFGFVTFLYAETVKTILAQGNPHFVRGSRVLVKPYREKGKLGDNRKYNDKTDSPLYSSYFHDSDHELYSASTTFDNSEIYRKNLMDRHDQALELETRRLSELHLLSKALNHQTFQTQFTDPLPHTAEELKLSKDLDGFASSEQFSYLLEALNSDSNNEKAKTANYNDQESQVYDLPESPFASPIASSISTAT